MNDEIIPTDEYTLVCENEPWKKTTITNYTVKEIQTQIYKDGKLIYDDPTIAEKKKFCEEQMNTIYPEVKRNEKPHQYYVDLSEQLMKTKLGLIADITEENAKIKQKKLGVR